jgi:hypothetical protein
LAKTRIPPAPTEGVFQVTATPIGATAEFDNNPALECQAPCSMTLSAGRHTFLVRSAGYRDAQRIIEIPHDTGLIVNLQRMHGLLSVITNPPGLTVLIDGKAQAQKSPAAFTLLPGPHHVTVIKGTDRQEFSVVIHDGSTISRTLDWAQ